MIISHLLREAIIYHRDVDATVCHRLTMEHHPEASCLMDSARRTHEKGAEGIAYESRVASDIPLLPRLSLFEYKLYFLSPLRPIKTSSISIWWEWYSFLRNMESETKAEKDARSWLELMERGGKEVCACHEINRLIATEAGKVWRKRFFFTSPRIESENWKQMEQNIRVMYARRDLFSDNDSASRPFPCSSSRRRLLMEL